MNRNSVTYRTVGSAALKPEFNERKEQTPIIDFDSLVSVDRHQRVYRAPRNLTFREKVSRALKADPLLGSVNNAFAPSKAPKVDKVLYAKCVALISVVTLLLILIGA